MPHSDLLPSTSLMITHAGLGTTLAALGNGVPMVCVPMGRDQFFNAEQVERLGAGRMLSPDADAETIAAAAREILADARHQVGAKRMATTIAGYGGAAQAAAALEALVDVPSRPYDAEVSRGHALPRMVFLDHCAAWSGGEIALKRLLVPLAADGPLVVLGEDGPLVGELDVQMEGFPGCCPGTAHQPALPAGDCAAAVAQPAGRGRLRAAGAAPATGRAGRPGPRQQPQERHLRMPGRTRRPGASGLARPRPGRAGLPPRRVVRLVRALLLLLPDAVLVDSEGGHPRDVGSDGAAHRPGPGARRPLPLATAGQAPHRPRH